jgi:hypothetical protein
MIKSAMENMGKIIIASYEKANTIVFNFLECLLAIFPDGGVHMPHCGRVSCLTYFPCFFFQINCLPQEL